MFKHFEFFYIETDIFYIIFIEQLKIIISSLKNIQNIFKMILNNNVPMLISRDFDHALEKYTLHRILWIILRCKC